MNSDGSEQMELGIAELLEESAAYPSLEDELREFNAFGTETVLTETNVTLPDGDTMRVPTYVNEYWTAKQRQASSLHEISYRACFKPQLPRFFIERLTTPGQRVHDPFLGRGTTALEAALLGRVPVGCDVNPLSTILTSPRLRPPRLEEVKQRLGSIDLMAHGREAVPEELLVFFHRETLMEICGLRSYLARRRDAGELDAVDAWIRLVALNRLTGHSAGFFSVYTLPPNQAVSVKSQIRINERRKQVPPRRDVPHLIYRKSRQLLRDCDAQVRRTLAGVADQAKVLNDAADRTPAIESGSVSLIVTSPPFLDIVQYAIDNWMRCWFCDIDPKGVKLTVPRDLEKWREAMTAVFRELHRVLHPGAWVAFEVGEVHKGETRLEEAVVPCGLAAGLEVRLIMVNAQSFTKTAHCWGVDNNSKGTNTNRIVVFRKRPV